MTKTEQDGGIGPCCSPARRFRGHSMASGCLALLPAGRLWPVLLAPTAAAPQAATAANPYVDMKVGPNDPCPCGSGKKFKQCHGKLA